MILLGCLQTLANLLRELKYITGANAEENSSIDDEVVTICDHLIKVDKLRTKRFEDLRELLSY